MASLHEAGVAHLDLKPENLLFVNGMLKVSDLGISRLLQSIQLTNESTMAADIPFPGTPAYMSPEQFEAPHPDDVDMRSDFYSLGVILFEMCHQRCRPPFGGSFEQLRFRHLQIQAPPVEGAGDRENAVIQRCLSKEPTGRYDGIDDLLAELDGRLTDPTDMPPDDNTVDKEQTQQLWQEVCQAVRSSAFEKAQRLCHKILQIAPQHDDARQMLDEVEGRFRQAGRIYRTIEKDMNSAPLDYLADLLKEAVDQYPDHPDGQIVQMRLGSVGRQFKESISQALLAVSQENWQTAQAAFERALQIDPTMTSLSQAAEFIKEVRQQIEQARTDIDGALQQQNWPKAMATARSVDDYVAKIKSMAR